MYNPTMRATSKPKLTWEQWEFVGQMSDAAFDYPGLDFEAVAAKLKVRFPTTPQGKLFRRECKAVFDRERAG
jgi:hypothetical protein